MNEAQKQAILKYCKAQKSAHSYLFLHDKQSKENLEQIREARNSAIALGLTPEQLQEAWRVYQ